ncbi:MAG: hypothetical protein IJL45_06275 [Prevotella sp.]|nr:hypothetical protein [Prevotella sp.]
MMHIDEARKFVQEVFEGEKDLDGKPSYLHSIEVGSCGETEEEVLTGLLHDVIEDSSYTVEDLRSRGVPENVLAALSLLTHDKEQSYDEYVNRIIESRNELAIKTKLRDLKNNLQRNDRKTRQKEKIYQKHLKALEKIERAVG